MKTHSIKEGYHRSVRDTKRGQFLHYTSTELILYSFLVVTLTPGPSDGRQNEIGAMSLAKYDRQT